MEGNMNCATKIALSTAKAVMPYVTVALTGYVMGYAITRGVNAASGQKEEAARKKAA
jgi:hypothetical protein